MEQNFKSPDEIHEDSINALGDDDGFEFIPCSKCDGHPACEDFGCAYELGLGRMVRRNTENGYDDWG